MRVFVFTLCVIFGMLSGQARAAVSYFFTQTTADAFNGAQLQIEYTVADTGAQASYKYLGPGQGFSGSLDGLLDFKFSGGIHKTITLDSIKAYLAACLLSPCVNLALNFSFDFHDGFASMKYGDFEDDFSFSGFPTAHVTANTDFGACNRSGMCQIDGYWTQVPEPTSLAVLGIGVLGIAGLRRRRAEQVLTE